MAFAGTKSSDFRRTIEQLKEICCDADPMELLLLAAGQHRLNVKFHDLLQNPELQTFMCSVEVGNLLQEQECIIGYGPTKKEAKINAAQEAILEITNRLNDLMSSASIPETSRSQVSSQERTSVKPYSQRSKTATPISSISGQASSQNSSSHQLFRRLGSLSSERQTSPLRPITARGPPTSKNIPFHLPQQNIGNPIGALKELADSHCWPQPIYEEIDEYGEDHKKMFVIECRHRDMVTEGVAPTKKLAKKKSAEQMLEKIEGNGNNPLKESSSHKSFLARGNKDFLSKNYVNTTSRLIQKDKLTKLASKRGWKIEWHNLGKGFKGMDLCFVRIKTNPPTVCSGSGIGRDLAHDEAARDALKILERMQ